MEAKEFIQLKDVCYSYDPSEVDEISVKDISLKIEPGQKVAIVGANGSGKSTLAKLMKALIFPDQGQVLIKGYSTETAKVLDNIHQNIALIFQNPENQVIATTVEADVAFGLENLNVAYEKMHKLVPEVLQKTGLSPLAQRKVFTLSGGEKQKLAIAAALVLKPEALILDEATSMLDPLASQEIFKLLANAYREYQPSFIFLSHDVKEISRADYVYALKEGKLAFQGTKLELFSNEKLINDLGLARPKYISISAELSKLLNEKLDIKALSSKEKAANFIQKILNKADNEGLEQALSRVSKDLVRETNLAKTKADYQDKIITARDLAYIYETSTGEKLYALKDINFDIYRGEFIGIVGPTGSGKSTLVQHFNGLSKLQAGQLEVFSLDLKDKENYRKLRTKVAYLMQYPEEQLFADTIYNDIAFGPKNLGLSKDEIDKRVKHSMELLEIDYLDPERSPFSISRGEMRKVAIAGVLAMQPEILILDEPSASLDNQAKENLYKLLLDLKAQGVTIIMVSHAISSLAKLADRIIYLNKAELKDFTDPKSLLNKYQDKEGISELMDFARCLKIYYPDLEIVNLRENELIKALLKSEVNKRG